MSVESFTGRGSSVPVEFRDFLGFFVVHKVQQVGQLASARPTYERYGIKRDRRKLYIEPLHLPPEDGEKGRGEVRSGTSCSAPPVRKIDRIEITTPSSSGGSSLPEHRSTVMGETPAGHLLPKSGPVNIASFKRNTSGSDGARKLDISASKARAAALLQQHHVGTDGKLDF
jgi:hypothetical protein